MGVIIAQGGCRVLQMLITGALLLFLITALQAGRQAGRTGIPGLQMKRQLSTAKVTHPVSQLPAGRNRLGLRSAHTPFSAVFPTVQPRGDKVGTCNWRGFWLTV